MAPSTATGTLERAQELFEEGRPESALRLLDKLHGRALPSSDRGRALALRAVCLDQLDRGDEAEHLIAEVMGEEGDDLGFVLAAGISFSDFDAFDHAEVFLRNLCKLDPENHLVWYNFAIALGREGRYPESVQMYEECIQRNAAFADAYFEKGYCLELVGDLDQAAAAYRGYLELEPGDAEAWKTLGIVESDRGKLGAADTAFELAVAIGEDVVDVYFNWAIAAVRAKDLERIEGCIAQMQASDPEGWRTLVTKADYEEVQGQVWPAWEMLCEAFDAVLEEEEGLGACGYVAARLIHFAVRHDMGVHVGECVERIFEEGLCSEDVLQALLSLDGRLSNAARSHEVVLKAAPVDDQDEPDGELFVACGVLAEDAAEAGELALEFEAKYGPCAWEVYSVQEITGPDEGHVGVYWRSEEMNRPPEG